MRTHRHLPAAAKFASSRSRSLCCSLACLLAVGAAATAGSDELPKRPEAIVFEPLSFVPPKAADFRHVLSNGVVVFLAPSRALPLIDLSMTFRGGEHLDPPAKAGLAEMTSSLVRSGGTSSMSPAEVDERLDFLATDVMVGSRGNGTITASLDSLTQNLDESLALLMDMLRRPRFDPARVRIEVDAIVEGMKQRNDDADAIIGREWAMAMYGTDHHEGRQATEASIRSITSDDMAAFAARVFNPANVVVAVSGDFEPAAMLAKLEAAFADWPKGERMPPPPAPTAVLAPGVYHVEKEIPQGKVFIGRRGIVRDDPDFFAALVMNEILGAGGFTSRIMKTVRSDEGLAYGAGSSLDPGVHYPGEFRAAFASKSPTVALGIKLILREFERMRDEPVGEEELAVAKQSFIETFPRAFESKPAMLGLFVGDEWTGRDPSYWHSYRDNVAKVTAEDVRRVARRLLDPDSMAILVVGDWDAIGPGDAMPGREGRARMADFFDDRVEHLPLRDPLTLEPMR